MEEESFPDVTLVTACFCFHPIHEGARPLHETLSSAEDLLRLPVYLVVYGDADTVPLLRARREAHGHGGADRTRFVECRHDQIDSFQYLERVRKNRTEYWPTRDERTSAETHLVTCNKFDFVLRVMNEDPFHTTSYAWIDAFVHPKMNKICTDYSPSLFMNLLRQIRPDKFHLQIMNVCDKKYIQPQWKREYYQQYRYVVCGCLFACGVRVGRPILERLKAIVKETVEGGWGHGEEMCYLEILEEFSDDLQRSYGDYQQIVNNFHGLRRNLGYVVHLILRKYVAYGYHREAHECAKHLLHSIESGQVQEPVSPHVYLEILFTCYLSAYKSQQPSMETLQWANHVLTTIRHHEPLQQLFSEREDYYQSRLDYIK